VEKKKKRGARPAPPSRQYVTFDGLQDHNGEHGLLCHEPRGMRGL